MIPRILVVDDNATNRSLLEHLLRDYDVSLAEDGAQALMVARQFLPDIVLLDVEMPDIDGYTVCRCLRSDPALLHTKILFVSAKTNREDRLEGYTTGGDDYITKPFDHAELMAKVRVYLDLKRAEEVALMQQQTFALISHELRTPVTHLIAPLDLLQDSDDPMLAMVRDGAQRLEKVIDRIIFLTRLHLDEAHLPAIELDVIELMRDSAETVAVEWEVSPDRFIVEVDEPIVLHGDRETVPLAIHALVTNAVQHGGPGPIRIYAREFGDIVVVEVENQGPKIPDSAIRRIFEPFNVGDLEHHERGHGLGLAMARKIANLHNGRLVIVSDDERTRARLELCSMPASVPAEV